ncbi:type II toxin-antitoxin system RelE/ParE family toxin [Sulfurimonas sp. SAG-AH-194-I05]|nr:type II toxin-antitoxin system RelE/ParE family toxin [Sulfurimonas sp. SAG-AH-194-I05]MDF1876180.1 type II toxin-antitoxin system RelE/ParE family toxin [Sulfurimonas sp. SAG-AH-194-I05]
MVSINWTDEASFWLKDIHDYIAQDNPKIAKKVINEIFKSRLSLCK